MVVIVVENVEPRLRGHLRRFLVEASTGVFVGELSARVRTRLWQRVVKDLNGGRATMVCSRAGEQGYTIEMEGVGDRDVIDLDGIQLSRNLTDST